MAAVSKTLLACRIEFGVAHLWTNIFAEIELKGDGFVASQPDFSGCAITSVS